MSRADIGVFRKVLVAMDGSAHATRALEVALTFAAKCEAEVILFHAVELHPMREDLERRVDAAARQIYQRVGEELAKEVLDRAGERVRAAGLEPTRQIGSGGAAQAIVDAAQAAKVDLIVVGTRGLTGVHGLALGSVAHKVTSMAPCPVMVVR